MNDTVTTAARVMMALSAAVLISAIWRGWDGDQRNAVRARGKGKKQQRPSEEEVFSGLAFGDAGSKLTAETGWSFVHLRIGSFCMVDLIIVDLFEFS